MQLLSRPLDQPIRSLLVLFFAWKLLLLLIAIASPGPGYDSSSALALASSSGQPSLPQSLNHIAQRLTRWDAIYFVTIAKRGYVHEQEWAFGYGFTKLVTLFTFGLQRLGLPAYEGIETIVASIIAHVAHLFSTIVLYKLSLAVFSRTFSTKAFLAAALHIISPAGLFLSAPYAESCCAFLSFAGCLNYVKAFPIDGRQSMSRDLLLLLAGVMFGAATTFRSNGILNGILLLEEAFRVANQLFRDFKLVTLRRLVATGLGGLMVAVGFILPQFVAYQEYCTERDTMIIKRTWCSKTLPSIYSFVQDHYWNVGPFRYWTLPNLPLFLLATPMYILLTMSVIWVFKLNSPSQLSSAKVQKATEAAFPRLRSLAIPQLALIILNLTTAHVQIITRISSAYPLWIWYTIWATERDRSSTMQYLIQFMVLYALIQGGLFASFLPPA